MNKLQAVFWDVDGTLAETEMEGHRVAFNYAFKELDLLWHWDKQLYTDLLRITGGANRIKAYVNKIKYELNEKEILDIHRMKQKHYKNIVLDGKIPTRIGVVRLINELAERNVQQWLVTTSGFKAVEALIHSAFKSQEKHFEGYITAESVTNHKPDPEAYMLALSKSKLTYNECLAIEDSTEGLKAATAAKIPCLITLSDSRHSNIQDMQGASAVLNHLGDIDAPCTTIQGQSSVDKVVNLEYLEALINLTK